MFKQARWKRLSTYAAVLVVGVVAICLLVGKVRERKEFIGNIDPASGYRCRFTIGSNWQCKDSRDRYHLIPVISNLDQACLI